MADALSTLLTGEGFQNDPADAAKFQSEQHAKGANNGGTYTVTDCFKKGNVVIHVEQNQASEDVSGMTATVQHPAVAIIESPKGRCAFNPSDLVLAKALVAELS